MRKLEWSDRWDAVKDPVNGINTPYVHFNDAVSGITPTLREENLFVSQPLRTLVSEDKALANDAPGTPPSNELDVLDNVLKRIGADRAPPPLSDGMATEFPDGKTYLEHGEVLPDMLKAGATLPKALHIDDETIIVGVIDLGIGLGHRRTRLANGDTRILASWQQSANRKAQNDGGTELHVPFGRELYASDINHLISAHSSTSGHLDEDSFNRACQTEDFTQLLGQRELAHHAAHGMHTLDLAAGLDTATQAEADQADQVRLMTANLPTREVVGHSAAFLEYFALFAIWRMIVTADALWDRNQERQSKTGTSGYRMVINLSFGKLASSRDGNDLIAKMLMLINAARAKKLRKWSVALCIPSGNENLERGNARFTLAKSQGHTLNWRILPEDQSANFVEIWGPVVYGTKNQPLEIEVVAPDGTGSGLSIGQNRTAKTLNQVQSGAIGNRQTREPEPQLIARIYCDLFTIDGRRRAKGNKKRRRFRMRYLIAVKQTLIYENTVTTAPAGVWKIRIRNRSRRKATVEATVQTDQTVNPVTAINQRSYFDCAQYQRFDATGRIVDSHTYPLDGSKPVNTDTSGLVRRSGTINAVGMSRHTATIAGYRGMDGRPVPVSSTGLKKGKKNGAIRSERPSAAFPARDGAAHFGVLSSGSRDGSVIAQEGTSFSAAMATRRMWQLLLINDPALTTPLPVRLLKSEASLTEQDNSLDFPGQVKAQKCGQGRLPTPLPIAAPDAAAADYTDRKRTERFPRYKT